MLLITLELVATRRQGTTGRAHYLGALTLYFLQINFGCRDHSVFQRGNVAAPSDHHSYY